jgi:hypothetical protein
VQRAPTSRETSFDSHAQSSVARAIARSTRRSYHAGYGRAPRAAYSAISAG